MQAGEVEESVKQGFRKSQRLAYQCVAHVGNNLQEGWTERQAAAELERYFQSKGVKHFFHRPLVWFGDRSRFSGFKGYREFLPTNRRLKRGDGVILDVAPIVDGFVSDVGYPIRFGPCPGHEEAMAWLKAMRRKIPKLFLQYKNAAVVWKQVDEEISKAGFENCHAKYPFKVLGHRVYKLSAWKLSKFYIPFSLLSWFPLHTQFKFLSRGIFPDLMGPRHTSSPLGLWAIEPHIGGSGFGVKFEEILVVEANKVYWLDDKVPHA